MVGTGVTGVLRQGLRHRLRWAVLLLTVLLSPGYQTVVRPQEMSLSVGLQVQFLFKIVSFDRSQEVRLRKGLTVGVLNQSLVRSSYMAAEEFERAAAGSATSFPGSVEVVRVEMGPEADLLRQLNELKVDVLYVAPMRSVDIRSVAEACRVLRILSFTGVEGYVREGVAVGVSRQGGKPVVLVNLAASRAAGSEFSSQLLRIAEVIE